MTKLYNIPKQTPVRRLLRKSMPKGEILLWRHLSHKQTGFKFRRQYGVDKYILDFYCPELHFGIEVDGLSHFNTTRKTMDALRQEDIESLGITIKRFTSDEVFDNIYKVVEEIQMICNTLSKNII